MTITLYQREDRYAEPVGKAKFVDKNMVLEEGYKILPGIRDRFPNDGRNFSHFDHSYSPTYKFEARGKINTRITYQSQIEPGKKIALYCKLNWFQRRILDHIGRKNLYQTHPLAFWGLTANVIFAVLNVYLLLQSQADVPYVHKMIEHQDQLLKEQSDILKHQLQHQSTILDHLHSDILKADTLKK